MSVATRNPFALLDEDNAPPPSPPPPVEKAAPPPAPAKRGRGGPASRGGKYYQRGGARPSTDRDQPSDDPPAAPDAKQRRFDGERKEGRGRGRGANRGRGRAYDRHSATGKTDSDKKLHNGWGGDDGNTELKVEEAATVDAAAESANPNSWDAPADASGGWDAPAQDAAAPEQAPDADKTDAPRRRDRDQEEEDNTLTLDQYFAQQKEKDSALPPKLEGRKANDGQDDDWANATRLEKGEGESYFSGKAKSAPKPRTEKKEKVFIEIEARFDRPSRGGRGRGADRGESRGRGGRGRGARGRGAANGSTAFVNVDDETAFPSLS